MMLCLPWHLGWFDEIGTNPLCVTLPSILNVARSFWVNSWNCLWGYCTWLGSLWLHNINRTFCVCHIAQGIQGKSTIVIVSRSLVVDLRTFLKLKLSLMVLYLPWLPCMVWPKYTDLYRSVPKYNQIYVPHWPRCPRWIEYCHCCNEICGGFWGISWNCLWWCCACLGYLGWCDTTRSIHICVTLPKVAKVSTIHSARVFWGNSKPLSESTVLTLTTLDDVTHIPKPICVTFTKVSKVSKVVIVLRRF